MFELIAFRGLRLARAGVCLRRTASLTLLVASVFVSPSLAHAQATAMIFWDPPASSSDVSYVVEWGPAPGEPVVSVPVPRGTTSFAATGLKPGVRNYFTVRAVDAQGRRSGPSNELSVVAVVSPQRTAGPAAFDMSAAWPDVTLMIEGAGDGGGTVAS